MPSKRCRVDQHMSASNIVFPQDLGGHIDGPASIWSLRECQLLESVNDTRCLAYLCRIAGVDHKRPISVLSLGQKFRD